MATVVSVEADLEREARRLLRELSARGLHVRLLGGVAIRIAVGEDFHPSLERAYNDIDLITPSRDGSEVEASLAELGWEPSREFNALNGSRRLLFADPETGHKLDAFVERFEMCHALPLIERFDARDDTLPPADLLLTKLQIVELNAKDRGDCYALLLGFPATGDGGADTIDVEWIGKLAARDWGLHHTLEINLQRLADALAEADFSAAERERVAASVAAIEAAMEVAPKSRGWKLRSRIGERKRWYEEPEEVA